MSAQNACEVTPGQASNPDNQPSNKEIDDLLDVLKTRSETAPFDFADELLTDKKYLTDLKIRLRERTLPPTLELELWRHRLGKPADTVRIAGHDGGPLKGLELRIVDSDTDE